MLRYASHLRSFAVLLALGALACSSDDSNATGATTGASTSSTGGQGGSGGAAAATTTATSGSAGSTGSATTAATGGAGGTSAGSGGSGGSSGGSAGSGGSGGSGAPDASTKDGAAGSGGGGSTDGGKPDGGTSDASESDATLPFKLTSSAFMEGGNFPAANTCNADMSPPLDWGPGPATTKGYAIVLWDRTNMFRHWALWDIPATTTSLPANLPKTATLTDPAGAKQISFRGNGYAGPCPPGGATDIYEFALYAVDVLPLPGNKTSAMAAETAIIAHQVAKTTLSGKGKAN